MARKLGEKQKIVVAEKFMDLANLTAVALVVTQLLSETFDVMVAIVGGALFVIEYLFAYQIMRGGGN